MTANTDGDCLADYKNHTSVCSAISSASMAGISAIDTEQAAVLASLKVKKPTADVEYTNL